MKQIRTTLSETQQHVSDLQQELSDIQKHKEQVMQKNKVCVYACGSLHQGVRECVVVLCM